MATNDRLQGLHQGIKLHLGCGLTHLDGWVNCDRTKHSPHVDEAFDLMADWPFPDNSVSAVYASHVLEHLPDPFHFFAELWRVLLPVGTALLRVPFGGHRSAWGDLTHLRAYYPESFAFVQPGYAAAVGNPQSDAWTAFFGLGSVDVRMDPAVIPWAKWRLLYRLLVPLLPYLPALSQEIFVDLFPLKTADAQAHYAATHVANAVPVQYIVYQHQWDRRTPAPGEPLTMRPLAVTHRTVLEQGYRS